jgi:hypothetical protein
MRGNRESLIHIMVSSVMTSYSLGKLLRMFQRNQLPISPLLHSYRVPPKHRQTSTRLQTIAVFRKSWRRACVREGGSSLPAAHGCTWFPPQSTGQGHSGSKPPVALQHQLAAPSWGLKQKKYCCRYAVTVHPVHRTYPYNCQSRENRLG